MERRPGTPMTRAQVGEQTGLSKVTASQLLARLEERGLVEAVGEQAGGPGPNAALYAVVPSTAYVAGLHVEHDEVSAGVADVTGRVVTEVSVDPNGTGNPVELVRGAVAAACVSAGVELSRLRALVIGTPGVLDPHTGDPRLAVNLPAWQEGVLEALRRDLRRPVTIENDVNLAAMAERAVGVAQGVDDFVLMWIGVGLGLATVIGGRLHRGVGGAAGEIGYLPVPGVPLPQDISHPATGAFQSLVGAQAVGPLAAEYERGRAFLDQLAARVATGVAAVCVVLDPGLVVLGGEVGRAGGTALTGRVAAEVGRICPARPQIVPTGVSGGPVLRGAILAAVDQARKELLASVAGP